LKHSHKGEITPAAENIINRDFKADKPNNKWLTDITEFHIPAGKIYLSPIIDCFDGLPVSWTIGTSPNAELVSVMLDEAISQLIEVEKTVVHSILIVVVTTAGQAGLNVLKKLSSQGQCQRKDARRIIQHAKASLAG
jgi:transposase InsO family protein